MRKAKKIKIKNQTLTREEPNNNKRIYGNYPIMVFLISSQFISDTQCMIASLATSQNWEKENPAAGGGDARPMAGPP
jgi:predicted class III extradiol MEMO1 family dioxygenase